MFTAARRRLTYANAAMTLALVFAMGGGAYAAGKFVITSTKQIKPSVLKQLKGKTGPAGPAGVNGAQGPQGLAGANGKDGAPGTSGTPGKDGASVTSTESKTKIGTCEKGGSEFTSASGKTFACNGKEGSPWTAGGTLPSEKTETGMWSMRVPKVVGSGVVVDVPISFTIRLAAALPEANIKIEPPGYTGTQPECPGTAEEAKAQAGFLCLYAFENKAGAEGELPLYRTPGGVDWVMYVTNPLSEGKVAVGSWAVTAP